MMVNDNDMMVTEIPVKENGKKVGGVALGAD